MKTYTHFLLQIVIFCIPFSIQSSALSISHSEFVLSSPPFSSCHAPTIAETADGDLLCAFFAGEKEGSKNVSIWMSRLHDNVWSKPIIVASDPSKIPCWNPVLTNVEGKLILFYKVGYHPQNWSGAYIESTNNGNTWSAVKPLPAGIYGPVKNKPLITNNNTLICGSSVESYQRWGCYVEVTKDFGKTWTRSNPINLPNNYFGMIQPTIVETNDKLLLLARTYDSRKIAKATSLDGGYTWSDATLTNLPNPNSGIDAIATSDNQILLVYNDSKTDRTPLNIACSKDSGITWKNILTLENSPGEYSYPAIIGKSDGSIVIAYTWNRTNIKVVTISNNQK